MDNNCGKDRLPTALACANESSTHRIGGRTEYENTNRNQIDRQRFRKTNIVNTVWIGRDDPREAGGAHHKGPTMIGVLPTRGRPLSNAK